MAKVFYVELSDEGEPGVVMLTDPRQDIEEQCNVEEGDVFAFVKAEGEDEAKMKAYLAVIGELGGVA